MRLLIGSDAPVALGRQADIRAWTQRVLWFAEDGDAVVLMDTPDPEFLEHVTRLTGVDRSTLHFHIVPGRRSSGNFDGWSLLNDAFVAQLAARAQEIAEIVALWPTPEVARLAERLGVAVRLAGAACMREGGGILANSKAVFRAMAASAGAPMPAGGVCRTLDDAVALSGCLLRCGGAMMVKRTYGGAGAGNEIVAIDTIAVSHAGHASAEVIGPGQEALHDYWTRRWTWASDDDAHPVVLEAFIPAARTLYAEVWCGHDGIGEAMIGELLFEEGRLARETFPAQGVAPAVTARLQEGAARLGHAYRAFGYRGHVSFDSVVTPAGDVLFTEANARHTSSTHLYAVLLGRVARPGSIAVQMTSPASWQIHDLARLLTVLARHDLLFTAETGRGLVCITPVIASSGHLILAAVAGNADAACALFDAARQVAGQHEKRGSTS